ncbi:hypothetical protein ABVT39_006705 [Epinephelus coioides]
MHACDQSYASTYIYLSQSITNEGECVGSTWDLWTNQNWTLGASAFCGFNPTEVLRTTPLFEHDVNYETMDHLKKFYFTRMKILRNKWHAITLSEYIRKKMIPRGLRILKPPSFGKDNQTFVNAWNGVLNKCSFALMAITIQYLNEEESKLQNEVLKNEEHLESLAQANNDVLKEMEDIDMKLTEHENEIKDLKKEKFIRDEKDYKKGYIYPWCKNNQSPTKPPLSVPAQHPTQKQQKAWPKDTQPRRRFHSTTPKIKKAQQTPPQANLPLHRFWTEVNSPL